MGPEPKQCLPASLHDHHTWPTSNTHALHLHVYHMGMGEGGGGGGGGRLKNIQHRDAFYKPETVVQFDKLALPIRT